MEAQCRRLHDSIKRKVCLSFVFAVTYDVCTERSEGMGPAHVQMG